MTDDLIARLRDKARSGQTYGGVTLCEAADALEAQARRIAELQQQVCSLIRRDPDDDKDARISELEAALKPFADKADKAEGPFEPPYPVDYPLWRAARAALENEKD